MQDDGSPRIQWIGENIRSAFSELGAVETVLTAVSRFEKAGWGLSFVVDWEPLEPTLSGWLAAAITAFSGALRWSAGSAFNERGVEVSAAPLGARPSHPFVSALLLEHEVADGEHERMTGMDHLGEGCVWHVHPRPDQVGGR